MSGGLEVDAEALPHGLVRIAVVDRDPRDYDLIVRRAGRPGIVGRIPPAGADRAEELLLHLESDRYILEAESAREPDLRAEFIVQPQPDPA